MKKFMKRGVTLLLCLVMLLSAMGTVSATPAEENGMVDAFLTECNDSEATAGTRISGAVETEWNELLGEMPRGELQKHVNSVQQNATTNAAIFYDDSDDVEEVLAYIRQQMKDRSGTIVFTLYAKRTYDYETFAANIMELALLHTGKGDEGDYLRWLWRNRSCGYKGYEKQYITYTLNYTYLTTAAQERAMDTAVANLLTQLNLNGLSDYRKVCKIYDWICANVTYDYTGLNQGINSSPLTWTPYKALMQGTSVCQGYALLFYRLALESGVDNRFISGTGNGGGHGWNIVRLGNCYYNLDSTWDSELKHAGYAYEFFLQPDATFGDHVRDAEYRTGEFYKNYPMATTAYNPNAVIPGEMNGDGRLDTDDAVYLLLNVMFGSGDYAVPATAKRDTNGDGKVDTDDAVYLLLHVMFGAEDYPLAV